MTEYYFVSISKRGTDEAKNIGGQKEIAARIARHDSTYATTGTRQQLVPWWPRESENLLAVSDVETGEFLLKMLHFGQVKRRDVGIVGIVGGVVLVIILGAIEAR
jgi:hypothetical protein